MEDKNSSKLRSSIRELNLFCLKLSLTHPVCLSGVILLHAYFSHFSPSDQVKTCHIYSLSMTPHESIKKLTNQLINQWYFIYTVIARFFPSYRLFLKNIFFLYWPILLLCNTDVQSISIFFVLSLSTVTVQQSTTAMLRRTFRTLGRYPFCSSNYCKLSVSLT